MPPRRILVGEFGRPHGVKGLLHLRSFTADPSDIAAYGPLSDEGGTRRYAVTVLPDGLARVEGVADRDAAAKLTNLRLYVGRDALPEPEEDEFYLSDLVGLAVQDAGGAAVGTVASVDDHGAGTFLTIRDAASGETLLPFTKACVPVVDIAAGRIMIAPPDVTVAEDAA